MTAIAIPYTSFGFAIAADGRQRWGDQSTRDNIVRASESDQVQKIFEIKRRDATFAYTFSGDVASRDRSFDLGTEIRRQLANIERNRFFTVRRFIEALSGHLDSAIRLAVSEGRAEGYPQCEIALAGYFRGPTTAL